MNRCTRAITVILFLSIAFSAIGAEPISGSGDTVIRSDAQPVPAGSIMRDDYIRVSLKRGSAEINVASCMIQRIIYSDANADYRTAIQKFDEGHFISAAMHFKQALASSKGSKWAVEYCNVGMGLALYAAGRFSSGPGRDGDIVFQPVSVYLKNALDANARSRFMPDILPKLVEALIHEHRTADAENALINARDRLKIYRNDCHDQIAAGYMQKAARVTAELALESARIVAQKYADKKVDALEVRDSWLGARTRCDSYPDLRQQSNAGVLNALLQMNDTASARKEAEALIAKFADGADDPAYPILPMAYMTLGKIEIANAEQMQSRGQILQANFAYSEARWNFIHVLAGGTIDDESICESQYFAGVCCDKLHSVEPNAKSLALRYWKKVIVTCQNNEYCKLAEQELKKVNGG